MYLVGEGGERGGGQGSKILIFVRSMPLLFDPKRPRYSPPVQLGFTCDLRIHRTTTPTQNISPDVRVAQIWRWSIRVLHSLLPFAPGNRRAARPCAHRLGTDTRLKSEKSEPQKARVFAMDPDALVEALRGTMDPSLREAAERRLNEVKVERGGGIVMEVAARFGFGPRTLTTSRWCDRARRSELPWRWN